MNANLVQELGQEQCDQLRLETEELIRRTKQLLQEMDVQSAMALKAKERLAELASFLEFAAKQRKAAGGPN